MLRTDSHCDDRSTRRSAPTGAPGDTVTAADFTYASRHDRLLQRSVIRGVELMSGRRWLKRIYDELNASGQATSKILDETLERLRIEVDFDPSRLESIPTSGPVVLVANHPFGVVDGLILCQLISRRREDFFLLVNEVITPQPMLGDHLLPIDFRPCKEALATNLKTKRATTGRLRDGEALAIFPAGVVATSATLKGGRAQEGPWHTFVSRRIHEARCPVVPVFFHGQNSRLFHVASHLHLNLRMGLLLHEVRNKVGKKIRVEIGEPIDYSEMETYTQAQRLIDYLRERTMELGAHSKTRRLARSSRRRRRRQVQTA